jgi:NAD(P)-dependent dehydrogenase (short-subunit alcohol dehydrogenase family)
MDKKIVITGASSGLGLEYARELIKAGNEVYNVDIQKPKEKLDYTFYKVDVRNYEAIQELATEIGEIDILINNAGINHLDYLENLEESDMRKVIETNVMGYYNVTKAFLPSLQRTKGTIVNTVSRSATTPMTASLPYNASKGAQLIMTEQMARELTKKNGITVFSISPNRLKGTGMTKYIDETVPKVRDWTKEYAEKYQKKNALVKEETDPNIIAKRLVDLLKDKHNFLSGCDLHFGI